MTADVTVRYFHFLSIFAAFALLTIEYLLLNQEISERQFRKLVVVDMAYAGSLLVVMLCGLGLWLWVGKPAGFYTGNWVYNTKITLFLLIILLRFFPSGFLMRNRRLLPRSIRTPKSIIWVVRLELALLCLIPLLAVLMADGVGYIH